MSEELHTYKRCEHCGELVKILEPDVAVFVGTAEEQLRAALAASQAECERCEETITAITDGQHLLLDRARKAESALSIEQEVSAAMGKQSNAHEVRVVELAAERDKWRGIAERVREYTEELESHFNNYPSVVLAPAYEAISRHLRAILDTAPDRRLAEPVEELVFPYGKISVCYCRYGRNCPLR